MHFQCNTIRHHTRKATARSIKSGVPYVLPFSASTIPSPCGLPCFFCTRTTITIATNFPLGTSSQSTAPNTVLWRTPTELSKQKKQRALSGVRGVAEVSNFRKHFRSDGSRAGKKLLVSLGARKCDSIGDVLASKNSLLVRRISVRRDQDYQRCKSRNVDSLAETRCQKIFDRLRVHTHSGLAKTQEDLQFVLGEQRSRTQPKMHWEKEHTSGRPLPTTMSCRMFETNCPRSATRRFFPSTFVGCCSGLGTKTEGDIGLSTGCAAKKKNLVTRVPKTQGNFFVQAYR